MKTLKFPLLALLVMTSSPGQSQCISWQNTIGGAGDDRNTYIQPTVDGGYIIGGTSNSNIGGDKSENSKGGRDYWVAKLDAVGTITWQKTIGGNMDDDLCAIRQTSDGGYLVGGTSESGISGNKTESLRGGKDYWIIKLDASGAILWQKDIGGSADDILSAVQPTADGGYILGGYSYSGVGGDKTEEAFGATDYWVVKLNTVGAILWQKSLGGDNIDVLLSVAQTTDNGYIIGGYSVSGATGNKISAAFGGEDIWIIKLDAAGNMIWQKAFGGSGTDVAYSTQQTLDSGYIVGGSSNSGISGNKSENSQGVSDYWILKLNAAGQIVWQNTIGGNGYDEVRAIHQLANGAYLVGGGSSSGANGDKTEASKGEDDYWVLQLDAAGNITWQNVVGSTSADYLTDMQPTADAGCLLSGWTAGGIGGNKTEASQGVFDYWIIKLGNSTNSILPASICPGSSYAFGGQMLTSPGVYQDTIAQGSGCEAVVTLTLSQFPAPLPSLPADTHQGCGNFTLYPGAFSSYLWNTGATTDSISVAGGTFTVTVTDQNGCTAVDTESYTSNSTLSVSIAVPEAIGCTQPEITLQTSGLSGATSGYTYTWATPNGHLVSGATTTMAVVNQAGAYILTVQEVATGCLGRDTVQVTGNTELPEIGLTVTPPTCDGQVGGSITLGLATSGLLPFQYALNGGAWQNAASFSNLPPGTYDLRIMGANGCETTLEATIDSVETLLLTLQEDNLTRTDTSVYIQALLTNAQGVVTYQWLGEGLNCTDCASPRLVSQRSDYIYCTVTDANGCQVTASLYVLRTSTAPNEGIPPNDVIAADPTTGEVPPVVFPDLEQNPDLYPNNDIVFFNRWGQVVWKAAPYLNDWRGTDRSGQPLPEGTYYYVLFLHGELKTIIHGNILLIR